MRVGYRAELFHWKTRQQALSAVPDQARDRQRKTVKSLGEEAKKLAAEYSPKRSGKLAAGYRVRYSDHADGGETEITNAVSYAAFVFSGTKPHIIRPKKARFLAFSGGGKQIFARQVSHPGTRPNDIPGRVAAALRPKAENELSRAVEDVRTSVARVFTD